MIRDEATSCDEDLKFQLGLFGVQFEENALYSDNPVDGMGGKEATRRC